MDADTASNNFPVRKDKHWSTGVKVALEVQPLPIGGEGFSSKLCSRGLWHLLVTESFLHVQY